MSPSIAVRFPALVLGLVLLAPPSAAQQFESPFMTEFRKLMQVKADDEMAALVRKREVEAIAAVVGTLEQMSIGSNENLEQDIDALGKAWKKAIGSGFVDNYYNYISVDLTPPYRKHRRELIDRYILLQADFEAAKSARDTSKLFPLGETHNSMGDEFADIGDAYMAAQCYLAYGMSFDDALNGDKADLRKACEGWGLFLQARDRLDLKDTIYIEAKVRYDDLVAKGFDVPAAESPDGAGAGPAATPENGGAASTAAPLHATFEVVPDIEAIRRPLFTADTLFQVWSAVGLDKVGSKGTFSTMEESPAVLRVGPAKAAVDVNGDGKGDVDIPLTGKITPVQVNLGGDAARPWAFLAVIGQDRDTYQGINPWNLGPSDENMSIYVAPASSLVGTVNGVRVRVIDDNMDGRYGSEPKTWKFNGLVEGSSQPELDTIVVGDSKVARPWSRLQKIGEAWFELAPTEAGNDITTAPMQVKTGTLQLDMKGLPVTWLVVEAQGEANEGLYYDVCNGGTNKVEVPIGNYELYVGEIASGKKDQMMKALILPSKKTRSWKVGAGETVKMELGQPLSLDFEITQDAETVTVVGASLAVTGRGNETYQRLWNCVLAPEVNLRKAGSSKGKKEAKMGLLESQQQMIDDFKNDWNMAWFPIGEPIQKPTPGETFEVQLFEKKHKLFGKLESEWKGK